MCICNPSIRTPICNNCLKMNDIEHETAIEASKIDFMYQQSYHRGLSDGMRAGQELMAKAYALQGVRYIYCEHCSEKIKNMLEGDNNEDINK